MKVGMNITPLETTRSLHLLVTGRAKDKSVSNIDVTSFESMKLCMITWLSKPQVIKLLIKLITK
jgi:hypothetical protein